MTSAKRIIGYDLARCVAVFGMVLVNFRIVMSRGQTEPAWLDHGIGLIEGRAVAVFVVLAGVGISLLTREPRTSNDPERLARDRRTLLKRALFLFVVGLSYAPVWPADILHFYGIYIALAAILLAAPTRLLWACAGALVGLFVVLLFTLPYDQGWNWKTLEYAGFWTPAGLVRHLFFNGFHPVIPWLAFLLLGMILGRQDLGDPAVRHRVLLLGTVTALIAEGASWLLVHTLSAGSDGGNLETIVAIFGTEPMPPMPLYMLAAAGTACAVIAIAVALGERFAGAAWLRPFSAVGQLALTLYVAHVILGMGILEGMGRLENQTLRFSAMASAVFCAASVIFAHLWRRRFKRGPLEALMRVLTNRRHP